MQKMRLLLILLFLIVSMKSLLFAQESRQTSLLLIGAGYSNANKYSDSLFQVEYKYRNYFLWHLKPQITLLFSKCYSKYIGFGVRWEFYLTKQIIITPSFSPGIYWKGKGRDLGYPIEFRSALEITYEMKNKMRIGIQIFHLSNAHLSCKNPGLNALTLCVAFPLIL
jgi:lipid A 3-O-deacylase